MLKYLSQELSFKLRAVLVTTTSTTTTTTPRPTANPVLATTTFHLNAEKVSCRQSMDQLTTIYSHQSKMSSSKKIAL